jgi:hypothetical protein
MKKILMIIIALSLAGCNRISGSSKASEWSSSQPPAQRDQLTAAELLATKTQRTEPVPNAYLMPVGTSAPALHTLEGTLSVPEFRMIYALNPEDAAFTTSAPAYFPGFSVSFFTYADYLVPVRREELLPPGKNSAWSIILSPGKTWSEPGDNGLSRASFPFALVASNSGESHNGVATFLYDDQRVSSIYLQITQETAAWQKTDFWGQAPMQYTPGAVAGRETLAEHFAQELDQQLPILPWSDLEAKYPALALKAFAGGLAPAEISAMGLVLDGAIYMPPCQTRYGEFPYCRAMRHGSFSVSKSMGAAVALLRLAEKYGQGVFDLKITDYVQAPENAYGWSQVTFGNALNMATGIGNGPNWGVAPNMMMVDEYTQLFDSFSQAKSAQEKLKVAFSYKNYPWGPGEIARYNSSTLFVLSAAMDSYLKSMEGPQADLWQMVTEEVYNPIGISYAPVLRTTEPDGSLGLPVLAYGLYPTVEDLARIALLLQNGGQYEGQQILHSGKLAEALRQTENLGLPTGDRTRYGDTTYLMSFWADAYKANDGRYLLIPYMSGYGGNRLVLAPNGVSSFRFTDSMNYNTYPLIRAAEAVQPFPGQGIPVSNLILLRGLWLVPENPAVMRVIDLLLLVWLLLTLAALMIYFWEVTHGRITSWGMRLFWLLALIVAGPLTLLVYILAYRQPLRSPHPETALNTARRALGSALIGAIGYTVGMVLAGFIINSYLAGSRRTFLSVLACLYGLPLAISLLCLRFPLTFLLYRRGFFARLGSITLVEFLSLNIGTIVYLPLSILAYNRFPLPNPATLNDIPSWLFYFSPMFLVTVAGLIVIYPIHAWMTHYGLSQWLLPVQTRKVFWWMVLILIIASLAVLLIAFQITMAVTS